MQCFTKNAVNIKNSEFISKTTASVFGSVCRLILKYFIYEFDTGVQ